MISQNSFQPWDGRDCKLGAKPGPWRASALRWSKLFSKDKGPPFPMWTIAVSNRTVKDGLGAKLS